MTNVREIAYEMLLAFDKGEAGNNFVGDVLDKYSYLNKQDRSFITRLYEGTLERMLTIDYVLNEFSKVPVRKMKPPVRSLLRMGAYQLLYMDHVPESAAVNETVKIAKKRGLHNLSGFINGVLRNVARNADNIKYPDRDKNIIEYLSVKYSCPQWIAELLVKQQGAEKAEIVLDNSVSVRPITVRVNKSRANIDDIIAGNTSANEEEYRLIPSKVLDEGLIIDNVDRVSDVNEVNLGFATVQDLSSMLVCHVAGIKETDRVIDVCASPGGKTLHAADLVTKGHVVSCDVSEDKIRRIEENVSRCHFENVTARCLDATVRCDELIGSADVLIADVPCSGLGVMGRKNDIKYRLAKEQLPALVNLQRSIIDNVVDYVRPGGTMMFSTCTINVQENNENVDYIIKKGFEPVDFYDELPEKLKDESAHDGFLQLYGKDHLTDGFFIAKFRKLN